MTRWTHTFWTAPALGPYPLAGFCSWEAFARCAVLSAVWLNRYQQSSRLVTDTLGKQWLVNELECPYDEVDATLDTSLIGVHPALFAAAKMVTYGRGCINCPVRHVDVDFISKQPLIGEPRKYPVVVANLESQQSVDEIYAEGTRFICDGMDTGKSVWASVDADDMSALPSPGNVAVLSIQDPGTRKEYLDEFWYLLNLPGNKDRLTVWLGDNPSTDRRTSINCCLEQMTLALVCRRRGVAMTPIFKQTNYSALSDSVTNSGAQVMHLIRYKENPDAAQGWLQGMRDEFARDNELRKYEDRVRSFNPTAGAIA